MRPRRFYTKDTLSVWTHLGKHLWFVWFCVFSIKTGTRRIIGLDELSFEIRLERRTMRDSSFRGIIRLVPVFILERTIEMSAHVHKKTDNASLVLKRPLE